MSAVVERVKKVYQEMYAQKYGRTDDSTDLQNVPRFVDFDELTIRNWGDKQVFLISRQSHPDIFAVNFPDEELAEEQYLLVAGITDDYLGIEELTAVTLDGDESHTSLRLDREYVRDARGRFARVSSSGSKTIPSNKTKPEAPERINSKTNIAQLKAIADKHGIATPKNAHRRASWHEAIKGHEEGGKYFEKGKKRAATTLAATASPKATPKATSKKAATPKTPKFSPEEVQKTKDKAELDHLLKNVDSSDHKQVARLGELFAKQYLKTSTVAPQHEKELFHKRKSIKNLRDNVIKQYGKDSREAQMHESSFREADQALKAVRKPRHEAIAKEHEALRNAIIQHHGLGDDEVEALVKRTKYTRVKKDADKVRKTQAEVYKLTGGKGSESLREMVQDKPRAYANKGRGVVNTGNSVRETDIAHEIGHHVEYNNAKLNKAANDWIRSRATSQTPERLSTLTGNVKYRNSEIALPDKFISPYVGKVYKSGNTEVFSMGIERFYTADSMREFHLADADHYHLTLGALLAKR